MLDECRNAFEPSTEVDCKKLKFYEACLTLQTHTNVTFWSRAVECEGCILNETAKCYAPTKIIITQTYWPVMYEIRNGTGQLCKGSYQFKEYGEYELNVSALSTGECLPKLVAEPEVALLSVLGTAATLLLMLLLWYLMLWPHHVSMYRSRLKNALERVIHGGSTGSSLNSRKDGANMKSRPAGGAPARVDAPPAPTARLRSLDTFRGATILIMIFVHAGGYHLTAFQLSAWNGLALVDLVFPGFAFAMGAAMALTATARLRRGAKRTELAAQVVRRSLMLCAIGIARNLVNAGGWRALQLTGVMQRLGAMYLAVGLTECVFNVPSRDHTDTSPFRDLADSWRQWLVTLALVAVQVFVFQIIPVYVSVWVAAPGCPRGYLGPGGLHLSAHGQTFQNCTGGIAGHIDRTIIGPSHLWRWNSTAQKLYESPISADGMGLLGCLSGVLVVQAGAQAFRIMNTYVDTRGLIILRWLIWSVTFALAGGAACGFSWNAGPVPINKSLTSLSYCLVTSSIAFLVQALLYFLVDWKKIWKGRPLCYAGQNSLTLYVGSEMLPLHWYKEDPTHSELLVPHAAVVLVWLAVAVLMHRYRIIITV